MNDVELEGRGMLPIAQAAGYQIVSNLHGPVGTFGSRKEALDFAKRVGIPISPQRSGGAYFIQPIVAPKTPQG